MFHDPTLPADRAEVAHFRSMTISWEMRDAARGTGGGMTTSEIRAALAKKAQEFRDRGSEIYMTKAAAEG